MNWNSQANQIFLTALEISDPQLRFEFLDTACKQDPLLREEVESLLEAHHSAEGFLEETNDSTLREPFDTVEVVAGPHSHGIPPGTLPPGTILGRYQIEEVLGVGSMGVVYGAKDNQLKRSVALKVPRMELASESKRWLREATSMAHLSHRNLLSILDLFEWNGLTVLVMPRIDGETLHQKMLGKPPWSSKETATFLLKLLDAVQTAHAAGVLHRDIKPANIVMDHELEPVLLDFGLAVLESDDPRITKSGTILGTPAYMAPEQVQGAQHRIGPASDLYALGAIGYELVTGKPVHEGNASQVMAALARGDAIRPPRLHRADIDRDLEAILQKALATEIDDRFPSAASFAEALKTYLDGKPVSLGHAPHSKASQRKVLWTAIIATSLFSIAAASLMLLLRTSHCDFVVTIDDPLVVARVSEEGGLVVENQLTRQIFKLKKGVNPLPFGDYQWVISNPKDLVFTETKFQLRRDNGPIIASVMAKPRITALDWNSPEAKQIIQSMPDELRTHPLFSSEWVWSDPINLGREIHPEGPMHESFISEDELTLLYRDGQTSKLATRPSPHENFREATTLTSDEYLFFPILSKDRNTLLFCSPIHSQLGGFDLQQWSLIDGKWGPTEWPEAYLNSPANDGQGWMSQNGLEFYFCSAREPSIGSDDIFVAKRRDRSERFAAPQWLPVPFNSRAQDFSPSLALDDRVLFFSSDRRGGLGEMDIFFSVRPNLEQPFSIPIRLDKPVNSEFSEGRPILSADGMTLYFDSNRTGGHRASDWWCIRRVRIAPGT